MFDWGQYGRPPLAFSWLLVVITYSRQRIKISVSVFSSVSNHAGFDVICSFTDVTFYEDTEVNVGEKVTLNCTSPRGLDYPTSVTWLHQLSSSNNNSVLFRIEGEQMSQFDSSGRLALNQTDGRHDFRLVIHEVQLNDTGRYTCSVAAAFEKQHVTVLRVRGSVRCFICCTVYQQFML